MPLTQAERQAAIAGSAPAPPHPKQGVTAASWPWLAGGAGLVFKRRRTVANWQEKISLNQTLARLGDEHDLSRQEEPCPTVVREAMAAEVEKSNRLFRHGKRIREAKSIAEVNRILEDVYNDADRHLVWCGWPEGE